MESRLSFVIFCVDTRPTIKKHLYDERISSLDGASMDKRVSILSVLEVEVPAQRQKTIDEGAELFCFPRQKHHQQLLLDLPDLLFGALCGGRGDGWSVRG